MKIRIEVKRVGAAACDCHVKEMPAGIPVLLTLKGSCPGCVVRAYISKWARENGRSVRSVECVIPGKSGGSSVYMASTSD